MTPHTDTQIVIGISGACDSTDSCRAMVASIEQAGQKAFFIGKHAGRSPEEDARAIDAIVFMGNDFDLDPHSYIHRYPEGDMRRCVHPETRSELSTPESAARGAYEDELMAIALKQRMPILGICGGMQRLNILCGGTLHQHVPDMVGDDRLMQSKKGICPKTAVIPIVIPSNTRLSMMARDIKMSFVRGGEDCPVVIMENSLHHQSIDRLGEGLRICSMSDVIRKADGTIDYMVKGIEADPAGIYRDQFLLGVQWHPEFGASPIGICITQHLVQAAKEFAILKET